MVIIANSAAIIPIYKKKLNILHTAWKILAFCNKIIKSLKCKLYISLDGVTLALLKFRDRLVYTFHHSK